MTTSDYKYDDESQSNISAQAQPDFLDSIAQLHDCYQNITNSIDLEYNLNLFLKLLKKKEVKDSELDEDIQDYFTSAILSSNSNQYFLLYIKIIKNLLQNSHSKKLVLRCFNEQMDSCLQEIISSNSDASIVYNSVIICSYIVSDRITSAKLSDFQLTQHTIDILSNFVEKKSSKLFNACISIIAGSTQLEENAPFVQFCVDIWNPSISLKLLYGFIKMHKSELNNIFPFLAASDVFIEILSFTISRLDREPFPIPLAPLFLDDQTYNALCIAYKCLRYLKEPDELIQFIDVEGLLDNIKTTFVPNIQIMSLKIIRFLIPKRDLQPQIMDANLDLMALLRGRVEVRAEVTIFLSILFDKYRDLPILEIITPEILNEIINLISDISQRYTQNAIFCLQSFISIFERHEIVEPQEIIGSQELYDALQECLEDENISDNMFTVVSDLIREIKYYLAQFKKSELKL
ncbi:hypothetical protein TVAG_468180 [Trichomonas vaginalis G3]|uniref:Uncharacterized protein n=1 Tax=Trichomonas vaginalis (strain ATCC PRA-98 / G3) TaxID=412133 RepID=A2E0Q7_TRIV3|nr:armadillo (ARM) repeat-containing protein family [Trichomonas vaginalis G3]EAY13802.1 hypothetical protein TVAG_468180 [Trichomonas vaginalis G3]KAI5542683.1 armadillo (ARM) repeat-containing protein family [Trichomonas vaginalis G3]|eukprot:XP_001326025.1 hypothetical protein [Trichomonas vaginalis G3]